MAAVRNVMYDWSVKYRGLLEDICLWTPMIIIYVDDVKQFSINFKPGTRFNLQTKRFEITEESRDVDLSGRISTTKMM